MYVQVSKFRGEGAHDWHPFAFNRSDAQWRCDLRRLICLLIWHICKLHNVSIQVRDIHVIAHQCLQQIDLCKIVQIVNILFVAHKTAALAARILKRAHIEHNMAAFAIAAFIAFVLEHNVVSIGGAALKLDPVRVTAFVDAATTAHATLFLHNLALAIALGARLLYLLHEADTNLSSLHDSATSAAFPALRNVVFVVGAVAKTMRTQRLSQNGQVINVSIVQLAQVQPNIGLNILATFLFVVVMRAMSLIEKHVKDTATATTTLFRRLVLFIVFDAFLAILIVDAPFVIV
mmetsp:Transcript_47702/g.79149  ORF Transcript_47702/g.79149 Transcript_47702/m.79149 type:complete len:290 (-) Transcript_47702:258-1127(-)